MNALGENGNEIPPPSTVQSYFNNTPNKKSNVIASPLRAHSRAISQRKSSTKSQTQTYRTICARRDIQRRLLNKDAEKEPKCTQFNNLISCLSSIGCQNKSNTLMSALQEMNVTLNEVQASPTMDGPMSGLKKMPSRPFTNTSVKRSQSTSSHCNNAMGLGTRKSQYKSILIQGKLIKKANQDILPVAPNLAKKEQSSKFKKRVSRANFRKKDQSVQNFYNINENLSNISNLQIQVDQDIFSGRSNERAKEQH